MEDKKHFDPVVELMSLDQIIPLKEFYSINIWNFGEIRMQGKFNSTTRKAAKDLDIKLEYDNDTDMLRGTNGNVYLILTE